MHRPLLYYSPCRTLLYYSLCRHYAVQFFWLLFDSDLTPAGKNLLDGRYSCFGYTTEGARFLSDLKEGDIIVSAKVIEGLGNLVPPKE